MNLKDYGWNEYFEEKMMKSNTCSLSMQPARIIADYGQMFRVVTETGEVLVSRPIRKVENDTQIAVGDWVILKKTQKDDIDDPYYSEQHAETQPFQVCSVLDRKTKISRAAAGIEVKEQIVAANVDTVFLIQSLNRDFNMRRLERYLIAAWESGAVPVVVLTKSDCCDDVADKLNIVYATCPGVEVHVISCVTGEGIKGIRKYFTSGKTVALLGSSGVGKSTLVNTLAGKELLKTQEIREDDSRGRHTTTHRELLLLPEGGLILDTPGMRALSLWEADTGMEVMFGDVEELTKLCRFHDCKHLTEPDCAVREAIDNGKLEMKRWESWLKLQKEFAHLEAKKEGKLRLQEKNFGKQIAKFKKELYKGRN